MFLHCAAGDDMRIVCKAMLLAKKKRNRYPQCNDGGFFVKGHKARKRSFIISITNFYY